MNGVFYVVRAEELTWKQLGRPAQLSDDRQFCTGGCEDRTWAREAEESTLLEAVTRERLVKKAGGKSLAGAVAICELWRLTVAL
jgi:hypothetical protein